MYRVSFIYDGEVLVECQLACKEEAYEVAETYRALAMRLCFEDYLCDIRVADLTTYQIIKQY